jgi:hypothetical protein
MPSTPEIGRRLCVCSIIELARLRPEADQDFRVLARQRQGLLVDRLLAANCPSHKPRPCFMAGTLEAQLSDMIRVSRKQAPVRILAR